MIKKKLSTLLTGVLSATLIMAQVVSARTYEDTYPLPNGDLLYVRGSCSTIGYNGTIDCYAHSDNYDVKILAETYTEVTPEPGVTLEVLTGEAFTTSYGKTVSSTWQTNGLYLLSQVELTHMEKNPSNGIGYSVLVLYVEP